MTAVRRDLAAVAALGALAAGVPLWLAAASGAIGIPGGDEWVYVRGAASLHATGVIDMPGHTAASVGQLLLVQPLLWLSGGMPWAFTAFGLVMGLLGVASAYLLARRFVGVGSAVLVGLLVFAVPGFARQTASFTTDVPAFALGALCLLLGVRWIHGEGGRLTLIASLAIGVLALSIREFALAAPVAVLAGAWIGNRPGQRLLLASASAVFAVGVVVVFLVADAVPGRSVAAAATLALPVQLGPMFLTLAAALLPASILAVGRRIRSLDPVHVLAAVGLVALIMVLAPEGPFLWGYLATAGGAPDAVLSGTREAVIPARAWALEQQLALLAGILAATLAIRWVQRRWAGVGSLRGARSAVVRVARSREGPLLIFLVLYAGGLAAFGSMNGLYDRYIYPAVPVAAILLLRGLGRSAAPTRSAAFATAALAWLMAVAVAVAANSLAYDAARWRAGEAAVALGYAPQTVDAGYEWVGAHEAGPGTPQTHDYGLTWYDDLWPSFRPCAVVSNSPLSLPGYSLVRVDSAAYRQYLLVGPDQPLYLYGAADTRCPRPTP